jgi:hypothetical protein
MNDKRFALRSCSLFLTILRLDGRYRAAFSRYNSSKQRSWEAIDWEKGYLYL